MKKQFALPLLFVVSILVFRFAPADSQLDKLLTGLEKYTAEYPQEKVHLQLDKPYYSVGEDVWFKAYVVNAEKNILYVDLLDERDSVPDKVPYPPPVHQAHYKKHQ